MRSALTVLTGIARRAVLALLAVLLVGLTIEEIDEGYWVSEQVLVIGLDDVQTGNL